jgi:outer membrane receptor protein involved in Fe transport
MKRIFIFILFFASVITAKAQFGGGSSIVGKISGTVIDSATKEPMPYATVSLYYANGHAPITGALTDDKGNFKLNEVKPGSYKLSFVFVGYPTKTITGVITTLAKPDRNVGIIRVASSAKALGEIQVTGKAPLIENHIDKIVYNAEKDITNVGGNASDVLQKVPLVSEDINGNVSLRGDPNVRVLINGKPSGAMSANLADVLKTIPADQIKSIEVITSPSAKYDAEGSAGIINIITKQKNVSGVSGSVSGGVGTRQNNGNFNLNYNKNRLSVTANIGGNLTWPQTSITNFSQVFQTDTSRSTQNYNRTATTKRYGSISSLSASYDFNDYNNITSSIRYNRGGFNTAGPQNNNAATYAGGVIVDSLTKNYSNTTSQHALFDGFDWNIDYAHKFHKEGHELDLSVQWSHSIVNTNYTNVYSAILPNQQSVDDGTNNEYTIQLDYTLPISKVLKLEAGGKTIIRRLNSIYDVYEPDFVTLDPVNTNTYDYNQNVYAGYTVLTLTLPKNWAILAGGRFESTDISGDPVNALQSLQPFSNSYPIYIPSLTIQKQVGTSQTWKLSYSKRITRPGLTQLNPFINMQNIQAQSEGNPELGPETSQTVELNYNTFIKSSVINLSVYYRHISNLIEAIASPIVVPVDTTTLNGTRTDNYNIGSNQSWGASFYGSINPINILTIRGSANAYTYNPNPNGAFAADQTSNGTYVQYNIFAMAELDFKNNIVAQVFTIDNSPRRTIQGTTPTFSLLGFGIRKQFDNKKASLGLNVLQPFNKYKYFDQDITSPGFSQVSSTAFPFRSVGLTFSYSFGKLNFSNPKQKNDPDEEKQGDQGMGGGAPAGGAPATGGGH